jgi:hypothetical protein
VRGYLSAVTAPARPIPTVSAAAAAVLLVAAVACAGAPVPNPAPAGTAAAVAGAAPTRPLALVAAQRVVVTPVQRVVGDATLGFDASALDAELGFALGERGLGSRWTAADAARRMARQNPTFTGDPGAVDFGVARPEAGDDLQEPAASQLRALAALADARYVVVPGEVRADSTGGAARAVLRVTLVDTRRQQVLWTGETEGVPLAAVPAPARAARVAARFVDLIAAPPQP